ncbi:MAG: toxin-antitoxin system YwqK family antitoxin [Fusobacteriaceae bacterium]
MKKIVMTIAILGLLLVGCGKKEVIMGTQSYKKDGLIYKENEIKPFTGRIILKHLNNQIYYEGSLKEGKPHGESAEYDDTGDLVKKGAFNNGEKHGEFVYYNEDGSVKKEEKYSNGKVVNSKEIWYYDNGEINMILENNDGSRNGILTKNYESGVMWHKGGYDNEQHHGTVSWYSKQENLMMIKSYKNGVLNGKSIFYEDDGKTVTKVIYYENGEVTKVEENKK